MTSKSVRNFALIGAAGYIAPRHLKAIRDTGNRLVCALDPFDSVGILDQYFPEVKFFTEFERFDRHIERLRRESEEDRINVVSICSPNYLHDAHIRFALRIGADVICEKPVVLNPWNIDALQVLERETGRCVNVVLQLRNHEAIKALKSRIETADEKRHQIDLKYITSRGPWYDFSWKGDVHKSGGISTNIGIHFFDMLIWIFGPVQSLVVQTCDERRASGHLTLEKADVNWQLSIDRGDLPEKAIAVKSPTYRALMIDGQELDFGHGFTDLHTIVYQYALQGRGFSLEDARPAVELVSQIRNL
jgi:UDP-N-acetyl-2-amino-2-deoxyglucuronate dehydrogenase